MPMLADCVDAVIGVDTHRDTHEAEIAHSSGAPIRTHSVSNDCTGYAELLAWIVDHAPRTPIEIRVSMVAAPWRRLVHVAQWNGQAPHTITGAARVSEIHCQ